MYTVECPKCTLRFEPDKTLTEARPDIFCPQCGHRFVAAPDTEDAVRLATTEAA